MFISLLEIIASLLSIVAITFVAPIGVALIYKEYQVLPSFLIPLASSVVFFLIVHFGLFKKQKVFFSIKFAFVIVACSWIFTSLFGSLPLYISRAIPSFTDAFFESVSGFSTTGSTILNEIESLPRSINLWRCMTHWLGGMGIVALTVALLPLLGVGGFQLIKAETTGPDKGKITPKITTTAKTLWIIYLVFTLMETVLLKLCGMDWVDALSHAFSTLGTGGFSTRNASIGGFNSLSIEIVITLFMFLSGINFSLYYYMFSGKSKEVKENSEFKSYIFIVLGFILGITLLLIKHYGGFFHALRIASFQVVSLITTTGFATCDYVVWPYASQVLIFSLLLIGGCSGSTAGGVKVIRWVVLFKQLNNEIRRMLHPHAVFSIRVNKKPGRNDIVYNVTSFMMIYVLVVFATTLVGCVGNLDILTSLTASLSMIGNVGPAFGRYSPSFSYADLPSFVKWWYCFSMLAGRLELYTMIIFFMPRYWKK